MRQYESEIQKACVRWFRYSYPKLALLLFSVPNGGSRHYLEAARLKAEGTVPGVADLILLIPNCNHNALCIEMKSEQGKNVQSIHQKDWQRAAERFGSKYVICRSLDEFIEVVTDYLSSSNAVKNAKSKDSKH